MSDEIHECRFCGSEDVDVEFGERWWCWVQCGHCDATGLRSVTSTQAIADWNEHCADPVAHTRRVILAECPQLVRVDAIAESLGDSYES